MYVGRRCMTDQPGWVVPANHAMRGYTEHVPYTAPHSQYSQLPTPRVTSTCSLKSRWLHMHGAAEA